MIEEFGTVDWVEDDMRYSLEEFADIYAHRPLRDNAGGMRAPHMFLCWFLMRTLNPQTIIESGVLRGQSTWLLEKACPEAQLHCIDPNLNRLVYRSSNAIYHTEDFSHLDWHGIDKENAVVFFDDHQDAYRRVKTASWLGFRHLIFEDNYPPSRGDCYSLKKAFAGAGFKPEVPRTIRGKLRYAISRHLCRSTDLIPPNQADARYLRMRLEIYRELPPVFKTEGTRWGDSWEEPAYPTKPPLLEGSEAPYQDLFKQEAQHYTWMCYVRLKKRM